VLLPNAVLLLLIAAGSVLLLFSPSMLTHVGLRRPRYPSRRQA
jgi:hypothetical protein